MHFNDSHDLLADFFYTPLLIKNASWGSSTTHYARSYPASVHPPFPIISSSISQVVQTIQTNSANKTEECRRPLAIHYANCRHCLLMGFARRPSATRCRHTAWKCLIRSLLILLLLRISGKFPLSAMTRLVVIRWLCQFGYKIPKLTCFIVFMQNEIIFFFYFAYLYWIVWTSSSMKKKRLQHISKISQVYIKCA